MCTLDEMHERALGNVTAARVLEDERAAQSSLRGAHLVVGPMSFNELMGG